MNEEEVLHMNIKQTIQMKLGHDPAIQCNDIDVSPETIKAILINEVVPTHPKDDFYGDEDSYYLTTTIPLFEQAGLEVTNAYDLLKHGIYLTNAVKTPKSKTTIERAMITESLPYLEAELSLFPNVKVIMCMGDVAKKAINMIFKQHTKQNIIPAISTYKLRNTIIEHKGIRIIPSYIMTGKNILIEKSKFQMATDDLANMLDLLSNSSSSL